MDDGQKTPRGHPDFFLTFKIYVFSNSRRRDDWTDWQTEKLIRHGLGNLSVPPGLLTCITNHTRCTWAGGTFFHCLRKVPPAHTQRLFNGRYFLCHTKKLGGCKTFELHMSPFLFWFWPASLCGMWKKVEKPGLSKLLGRGNIPLRGAETWGFHESPSYPHIHVLLSGLEKKNGI